MQPGAGEPDHDPAAAVTTTLSVREAASIQPPASPYAFCDSATVYAPIAMNAPWPSESCPDSPVRTVSPAVAQKYAQTVASW
ncbi:hypothetical protein ACFQX7_00395 [Luedemannella flava]